MKKISPTTKQLLFGVCLGLLLCLIITPIFIQHIDYLYQDNTLSNQQIHKKVNQLFYLYTLITILTMYFIPSLIEKVITTDTKPAAKEISNIKVSKPVNNKAHPIKSIIIFLSIVILIIMIAILARYFDQQQTINLQDISNTAQTTESAERIITNQSINMSKEYIPKLQIAPFILFRLKIILMIFIMIAAIILGIIDKRATDRYNYVQVKNISDLKIKKQMKNKAIKNTCIVLLMIEIVLFISILAPIVKELMLLW